VRELGTIAVVYRCWAFVHTDSLRRDGAGKIVGYNAPVKFLVMEDQKGNGTFPVFSDGDLTARFKKEFGGFDDYLTLKIPTPAMLVDILKQSRGSINAMSFDQPKMGAKPFAIWPLEFAIQKLEAGELL
jgi:hypothetical protein